jgi:hypothetical protein
MNKEQQELLDEVYENYTKYPLATIHDHRTNILYQNRDKGWCVLNGRSMVSPHPTRHLTQQEFINKCKTEDALSLKWREEYRNLQYGSKEEIEHLSKHYTSDTEFSERWGLKIEERELSKDERIDLYCKEYTGGVKGKYEPPFDDFIDSKLTTRNIPTKLITITYNDKTIESYE